MQVRPIKFADMVGIEAFMKFRLLCQEISFFFILCLPIFAYIKLGGIYLWPILPT